MPVITIAHGGDDKGRLYRLGVRDLEIESRIWGWGSAYRIKDGGLFVRNKRFAIGEWVGSPSLAHDCYRMKWEPLYQLICWLQQIKTGDLHVYEVEMGEERLSNLFNSRARIRRSDVQAALMNDEELSARKATRSAEIAPPIQEARG